MFSLAGASVHAVENEPEDNASVTQDVAVTIALLFVLANLDHTNWDMTTNIQSIEPFYNNDEMVEAYCINLITSDGQAGYVIVSTDMHKPLIQEYSDVNSPLTNTDSRSGSGSFGTRIVAASERVYYYGPLNYGYEKLTEKERAGESTTALTDAEDFC